MNQIREYLKRPLITGIVGLVVGLVLGLVVLGWWLWPVQWIDASPAEMHPDYQAIWLQMAISSYGTTGDASKAKLAYDALGKSAADTLATVKSKPGNIDPSLISQFQAAVSATAQIPSATQGATQSTETTPTSSTTKAGRSNLTTLLFVMCGVVLVVGAGIVAYFFLQNRKRATGIAPITQMPVSEVETPAEWTNYPAATEQAPMVQFMASYKAGDDLFDDSFSVDSPSGEFLGECGVGISETIGVGVPKKVTAFEVWLFDKNDIQTVTKVLMSAHAFNDPTIRQKLEAKGEPFQAVSGGQTILETATLKLVARVVDMAYGQGALPENSYFDSLVLELAIWQKQ